MFGASKICDLVQLLNLSDHFLPGKMGCHEYLLCIPPGVLANSKVEPRWAALAR